MRMAITAMEGNLTLRKNHISIQESIHTYIWWRENVSAPNGCDIWGGRGKALAILNFSTTRMWIYVRLRPFYCRRKNHGSKLYPKPVWTQWQKNVCRGLNPRPTNSVEWYRPMWRKWSNDCQQLEGQHQKSAHVISTFKRVLSNFVQSSSSKRLAQNEASYHR